MIETDQAPITTNLNEYLNYVPEGYGVTGLIDKSQDPESERARVPVLVPVYGIYNVRKQKITVCMGLEVAGEED